MDNELKINTDNVPSFILEYIDGLDFATDDTANDYRKLIKNVPVGMKEPSFNDYIYVYNMRKLQRMIDMQSQSIEFCKQKLSATADKEEKASLHKQLRASENQLHQFLKDALKYSNMGLDRETPKKIEQTVRRFDFTALGEEIIKAKNITPKDEKQ